MTKASANAFSNQYQKPEVLAAQDEDQSGTKQRIGMSQTSYDNVLSYS